MKINPMNPQIHAKRDQDPNGEFDGGETNLATTLTPPALLAPVGPAIPQQLEATAKGRTRVRMYPNRAEFLAARLGIVDLNGVGK